METMPHSRKRSSDLDALKDYYFSDSQHTLSEHLEELDRALQDIRRLEYKDEMPSDIVRIVSKQYQCSSATVWRWIRYTKDIFGQLEKVNKDFQRAKLRQERRDLKAMAQELEPKDAYNCLAKAIELGIKLDALDKDDPDLPSFKDVLPPVTLIVLDNATLAAMRQELGTGIVSDEKTEDTTYEDLTGTV